MDWNDIDKHFPAPVGAAVMELMNLGSSDGGHHKQYALDQVLRILTNCPVEQRTAKDYRGEEYVYNALGESDLYKQVVAAFEDGEDGPHTYSWEEGTPP